MANPEVRRKHKIAVNKPEYKEKVKHIGKDNSSWKGGLALYHKQEIVKIDNRCSLCKGTYKLEIHHKNHDAEINDRSNLILLCIYCHKFWHYDDDEKNRNYKTGRYIK